MCFWTQFLVVVNMSWVFCFDICIVSARNKVKEGAGLKRVLRNMVLYYYIPTTFLTESIVEIKMQ